MKEHRTYLYDRIIAQARDEERIQQDFRGEYLVLTEDEADDIAMTRKVLPQRIFRARVEPLEWWFRWAAVDFYARI